MQVEYKEFASNRFFGVELEVGREIPRSIISNVIKRYSKKKVVISNYVNSVNNNYWVVKTDSSCGKKVDHLGQNEGGYEITSYKASGIEDIKTISNISGEIKKIGVKTNHNCGYHIHVDVSDFSEAEMGNLIGHWLCEEEAFFSSVPERRKFNNYCKKLKLKNINKINFSSSLEIYNKYKPNVANIRNAAEKRYSFNLLNYYVSLKKPNFKRKTVEFRFPEGTLTPSTVENFIIILINFVETVKQKNTFPKILTNYKIDEILNICGLDHDEDKFYIFDRNLFEARKWFLKRLARYDCTFGQDYKNLAESILDKLNKRG